MQKARRGRRDRQRKRPPRRRQEQREGQQAGASRRAAGASGQNFTAGAVSAPGFDWKYGRCAKPVKEATTEAGKLRTRAL